MTNTHKLKGWNPDMEPEVTLEMDCPPFAYVYIDDLPYRIPSSWLEPLQDNGIQSGSTETD